MGALLLLTRREADTHPVITSAIPGGHGGCKEGPKWPGKAYHVSLKSEEHREVSRWEGTYSRWKNPTRATDLVATPT